MVDGGRGVVSAARRTPGTASMEKLAAQVRTCQLCRLAKTRTNAVPGEGNVQAEVMFIGEGPGYHEDKQGLPFVGAAGQFLNELLQLAGLDRASVYIANVVKCRPPNNRDPEPDEIAACAPYLERQIAIINPGVIVTLGRYSMARFFPGERISTIHGTAHIVDGRMCVAMYHPAAGLHQASLADIIRSDFRKLPIFIEQARKMLSQSALSTEEERIAEAESAREQVIQQPETAAILASDQPETNGHEDAPAAAEPLMLRESRAAKPKAQKDEPSTAARVAKTASEGPPVEPKPKKEPTKRKKPPEKTNDYEQLTFF